MPILLHPSVTRWNERGKLIVRLRRMRCTRCGCNTGHMEVAEDLQIPGPAAPITFTVTAWRCGRCRSLRY